jgi:hypothetical protein
VKAKVPGLVAVGLVVVGPVVVGLVVAVSGRVVTECS